jgi:hypothetical protein
MATKERYADVSHTRILESPRDALEREYADSEANADARQIWDRLGKLPKHRQRVIQLLANALLETMPQSAIVSDKMNSTTTGMLDV